MVVPKGLDAYSVAFVFSFEGGLYAEELEPCLKKAQLDEILLGKGSALISKMPQSIKDLFSDAGITHDVNVDEAVVHELMKVMTSSDSQGRWRR